MTKPVDKQRRNVLAMMGLAPATALGVEAFRGPIDGLPAGRITKEQLADALVKFADEVRLGAVMIKKLEVHGKIGVEEVDTHTLSIEFFYMGVLA